MIKTLCIFGTRPEAIKMAPLIKSLNAHASFQNLVCLTGQHQELLNPLLGQLGIEPDFNISALKKNQGLAQLTARVLTGLDDVLQKAKPDIVLVHGDTTTTLAASLSSYYHQIPVGHVEAGLRTGNNYSPWPEEMNRKISGAISTLHFAPTRQAKTNLLKENQPEDSIFITGNTVVDSLYQACELIDNDNVLKQNLKQSLGKKISFFEQDQNRKFILVTGHRRENFGAGFKQICEALKQIATQRPDLDIVYPVHLNPNVQKPVYEFLSEFENIHLIEPLDYLSFIYLMRQAHLILTDSGGIQEEAPSLGKPVLVMRENSERPEAIDAGTVKLIGTKSDHIVREVLTLIDDQSKYDAMSDAINPYGDGKASERIINVLLAHFSKNPDKWEQGLQELVQ